MSDIEASYDKATREQMLEDEIGHMNYDEFVAMREQEELEYGDAQYQQIRERDSFPD